MSVLTHSVQIKAPHQKVYDFLLHYKENFPLWHSNGQECRYLTEGPLGVGTLIYEEETLHGKLYKFKLRITRLKPNERIDYQILSIGHGAFIIEPKGPDSSIFTAEIHFGSGLSLIDDLISPFMAEQIEAIKEHMANEGKNLKRILEGKRSEKP